MHSDTMKPTEDKPISKVLTEEAARQLAERAWNHAIDHQEEAWTAHTFADWWDKNKPR